MTILITGAAGFIGSHLAERLANMGRDVVALDNFNDYYSPARKQANAETYRRSPGVYFYEADFGDEEAMADIFERHAIDVVAHIGAYAAGRYSIGRARLYTQVNVLGTVNLLEAARQAGAEHFVFASTSSVYGHTTQLPFVETDPCNAPLAPYPASKKAIEVLGYSYYNLHKMNFTGLRFFNVYGPRGRPDMMPYMVTERLLKGQEIKLFNAGQMKRDWTYIDDIINGVIAALDRPLGYELINLGRGEPVLMADFVELLENIVGKKAILATPPAPASEPQITFANIDKARRLLDYHPQTSIAEGLTAFWEWYQQEVGP